MQDPLLHLECKCTDSAGPSSALRVQVQAFAHALGLSAQCALALNALWLTGPSGSTLAEGAKFALPQCLARVVAAAAVAAATKLWIAVAARNDPKWKAPPDSFQDVTRTTR